MYVCNETNLIFVTHPFLALLGGLFYRLPCLGPANDVSISDATMGLSIPNFTQC